MSSQYGECAECEESILISCTNADWHPAMYRGKPICQECYDELEQEAQLTPEGYS